MPKRPAKLKYGPSDALNAHSDAPEGPTLVSQERELLARMQTVSRAPKVPPLTITT